jgi:peptide/nickel transport system ATP-binding protein
MSSDLDSMCVRPEVQSLGAAPEGGEAGIGTDAVTTDAMTTDAMSTMPVLELKDVRKAYSRPHRLTVRKGSRSALMALDGVSLHLAEREILGLVGESGAGKSTIGEIMVGLVPVTSGDVLWRGTSVGSLSPRARRAFRREVQMVFQDPYATIDPHFTTYDSVVEPVAIAGVRDTTRRLELVRTALVRCELQPTDRLLSARPHQLSGGQLQRVAIARAIVMEPRVLVADEPVSMLDASARGGVLNLFKHLRDELGLSIVYISHDLPSIRYLCERIAVVFAGTVFEIGTADDIIESPHHPYTRELLEAIPSTEAPIVGRPPVDVGREDVVPVGVAGTCRFLARCPYAAADCSAGEPALSELSPGHEVRCIHPVMVPMWKSSGAAAELSKASWNSG